MKISATVKGIKQAEISLQALADKIERGAIRQALNKAATPILREARHLVPTDSKALKKSLGKRVVTNVRRGTVQVKIGPRKGKAIEHRGRRRNPIRYAHLVEFGSSRNRARPYLRPAHDAKSAEAKQIYKDNIKEAIEKNARRLNKRYKG